MFRRFSKKRLAVALSAVAVVAVAATAFAYLSSTGTGTGNGNVTATSKTLAITFSQPDFTNIGQTQIVSIYATNSGTSPEYFNSLTSYSVASADPTSCPSGSFTSDTPVTTPTEIPDNNTPVLVGTAHVTFNDTNSLQDKCVGSKTVAYSANSN